MLGASFQQLNAEFGFAFTLASAPQLERFVERAGPDRAQLRPLPRPDAGLAPVERRASWSSSGACWCPSCAWCSRTRPARSSCGTRPPRRRSICSCASGAVRFKHRREALQRIQAAAGELEQRIAEVEPQDKRLAGLQWRLDSMVEQAARRWRSDAAAAADARRPPPGGRRSRAQRSLSAAADARLTGDIARRVIALAAGASAATACPGRTRATPTACGCPRSCCSRRRWPRCWTTTRASCSASRTCARWPPRRWTTCSRCGAAWATTAARATCTAARRWCSASTAARSRDSSAGAGAAARHRPLHRRGDRRVLLRRARGHPRRQRQARARPRARLRRRPVAARRTSARCGSTAQALLPDARRRALHPGPDGPRRHAVHARATRPASAARWPRCAWPTREGRPEAYPVKTRRAAARRARARAAVAGAGRSALAGAAARAAASGPGCGACREFDALDALQHAAARLAGPRRGAAGDRPRADAFRLAPAAAALAAAGAPVGRAPRGARQRSCRRAAGSASTQALAMGLPAPVRKLLAPLSAA